MSDLLDKITLNADRLMDICPSIFTSNQDGPIVSGKDIEFDIKNFVNSDTITMYQKKYFDKVEEGNRYLDELEEIEEQYFKAKYGEKIYKHIKNKRKSYIGKSIENQGQQNSCGDFWILTHLHTIYNDISGINTHDFKKLKKNMGIIEDDVTKMINETETNKRKVEYRHDVALDVQVQSQIATYIYYFILICIFIFLFSRNALNIKKNIILYGVIILFPLIYRYIFIGLVYVYNLIEYYFTHRGPKNAFLDNTIDLQFLDDYDI